MFNSMDVQNEYKQIDHTLERLRKTSRGKFGITEYCLRTALAILALTNLDTSLAVQWLFDKRRRGVPLNNTVQRQDVEDFLTNIVIQSSADTILSWGNAQASPVLNCVRTAHKVIADNHTVQILADANVRLGRAPSSASVLHNININRRKRALDGEDYFYLSSRRKHLISTPRAFMSKWRRKHDLKIGKIRFGEPLTVDQKREKVSPKNGARVPTFVTPFLGPQILKTAPENGAILATILYIFS